MACSSGNGSDAPSDLPACGTATLLTVSPLAYSDIRELAPLGNLNPPGHTFPTDHMYFYPPVTASATASVPVVSPGSIRVTEVFLQKRTGGSTAEFDDYGLTFYPCTNQQFNFGHVSSLSASLATQVGTLGASCDTPYQTGGFTFQQCRKSVNISMSPGEPIGTAGGPGQGALDLGAADYGAAPLAYVDPGRANNLHAACPLDYFTATVRTALNALIAVNGNHRTVEPVCGTIMQDVANTAQGRWFFDATTNEDHHLALVHASWDPTIGAFSIGTSLTGSNQKVLTFAPTQSGRVNLDFNRVTADSKIYCYQFTNESGTTALLQLETNSHLKIQLNASSSCGDPATWSFGANAVGFDR